MKPVLTVYDVYHLAQQRTKVNTTEKKTTETKSTQKKAPEKKEQPQSIWSTFLFFGAMILIFYFLLIRPQKKKQKEHESFVSTLKKGDKVITNSGIFGRIVGVDETIATVEIAQGVRVKMLKSQVSGQQGAATGSEQKDKSGGKIQRKMA